MTEVGPVELDVPRDRDGSFEPKSVKKRQRRLGRVDQIVLSLTARGLTTGGSLPTSLTSRTNVSKDTVSRTTDKVIGPLRRAMAHDLAVRDVAEYVELPEGMGGRPSKSFTAAQADAILRGTTEHQMHAYIVVSLLTGARTEELRALTWEQVALDPAEGVPPHMMVWRSTRRRGETKTRKSRRTVALPAMCVRALQQRVRQSRERTEADAEWVEIRLVFTTQLGGQLDANNVLRGISGRKGVFLPRPTCQSLASVRS